MNRAKKRALSAIATVPRRAPACGDCPEWEACLPAVLPPSGWREVNKGFCVRQGMQGGRALYRAGDDFAAIYSVCAGSFKSTAIGTDGRLRMTGIHLRGEILGTDGIATRRHCCDVVALEESEVCVIPFASMKRMCAEVPDVQRWFHKVLGREIVEAFNTIAMIGNGRAEERVAAFLVNLSRRLTEKGYPGWDIGLHLSRHDIGTHLGLTAETTSRALSRLQREGAVAIADGHIHLRDRARLKRWASVCNEQPVCQGPPSEAPRPRDARRTLARVRSIHDASEIRSPEAS